MAGIKVGKVGIWMKAPNNEILLSGALAINLVAGEATSQ